MITENLSILKINTMTRAQYERELAAGRINPNEMYLTPDTESGGSGGNVYVQANEPIGAPSGALWVDTDADMCTITCNLTNCTSNNAATSIALEEPYTATFTCGSGYTMESYTATIDGKSCGTFTRNSSRSVTLNVVAVTGDLIITVYAGN